MGNNNQSFAVNVLLLGMDDKKAAVFNMAFKMKAGMHYTIIGQDNAEKPDFIIVDVDNLDGAALWKKVQKDYPDTPKMMVSVSLPENPEPFLQKPIKIDALFKAMRDVMQGGGIVVPDEAERKKKKFVVARKDDDEEVSDFIVHKLSNEKPLPVSEINKFDITLGLLGAVETASLQDKDMLLMCHEKPMMIVFPSVEKILLLVAPDVLEGIAQESAAEIKCQEIKDKPEWREKANVKIETCLWQCAIWTAQGRLISPIHQNTKMRLKEWPNLTRLAHIPDAIRMSAFMNQTTTDLGLLYKIMQIRMDDLLNFIAATYCSGILVIDAEELKALALNSTGGDIQEGNGLQEDSITIRRKYKGHSTGMLQRLMNRLTGKD